MNEGDLEEVNSNLCDAFDYLSHHIYGTIEKTFDFIYSNGDFDFQD